MPVPVVPSVMHQDLMANKKLEDPYLRLNELKAQWVNDKTWQYRHEFQSPQVPAGATVVLVFDGLDTFATVALDGEKILESSNMFLGYRVNIIKALTSKESHVLDIKFDCAKSKAREIRGQHPLYGR
ncbi:putative beta-mannosidase B [Talaromyces islandicus]|uniref:Putative beta-mannosidase B n=1 Tax=Talaromyces islandicus TaxID=28573 RepID=A0A0U1LYT0_TALIS|nr:putative beta-mannosidase B [Talaromyces islandicus]